MTASYEMIVLTDELVAMTDHLMKGIAVNDETLLLDELERVGPGGHFLNTEATTERFREFWYPSLLSREIRPQWLERGGTTLGERLRKRVLEIIEGHRPRALAVEKKAGVGEILARGSGLIGR